MSLTCKYLPDMLGSEKYSLQEKTTLQLFHDRAAARLSQIFNNEAHYHRLLHTIRGSPYRLQAEYYGLDGGISTLQSLFQDILDDIEVHLQYFILLSMNKSIYKYNTFINMLKSSFFLLFKGG